MRPALLSAVLVVLCACPDKGRSADEDDPLIRKLKAEQQRLEQGGAPGGPPGRPREPVQPLAELAQQVPDVPVAAPVREAPTTVGAITVTPRRLETAQIISGGKVKLSTSDRFARLVVAVSTTKDVSLDLSRATLVRGAESFELARDVQRVGQGSPLTASISAGITQDLVLYFELPVSSLGAGLSLVLATPDGTLTAPLQ